MNYSKISYEQILSLADQLRNSAQNMEGLLGEVSGLLNQIGTAEIWNGNAAQTAKTKFDALIAKFPEFYNATNQCHTHLVSVVENYKNIDTSVQNM